MNFFAPKNIFLLLGDLLLAIVAVYASVFIRFIGSSAPLQEYSPVLIKGITFAFAMVLMCYFLDLYKFNSHDSKRLIFMKISVAGIMTSIFLAAFYYFFPAVRLWRGILILSVSQTVIYQSLWHVMHGIFMRLPVIANRVLILGTGPIASTMGDLLHSNKDSGFSLAGYINCDGDSVNVPDTNILDSRGGLLATATKEKVQKIVVSLNERRGTLPVREVLDCKLKGIEIVDGPSFYEQLTGKLLIENMNPSHFIFSEGFRITALRRTVKRICDVVLALVVILLTMPLLMIVPLIIKLDSRGPVLFKQDRVGEGEKIFTVYKFRTMVTDAEKESGPVWSSNGDKRITRVGRVLRKFRIDEIPQLFNVLKGDMSFVGPRPEREFFVESLKKQIPYYSERHCVKPGLTGWAQVRYEYGDSIEDAVEKLRYDLYYIKYQSLSLDILIVLDTIKVILSGFGGR